jgi:hypothetical protein
MIVCPVCQKRFSGSDVPKASAKVILFFVTAKYFGAKVWP